MHLLLLHNLQVSYYTNLHLKGAEEISIPCLMLGPDQGMLSKDFISVSNLSTESRKVFFHLDIAN